MDDDEIEAWWEAREREGRDDRRERRPDRTERVVIYCDSCGAELPTQGKKCLMCGECTRCP